MHVLFFYDFNQTNLGLTQSENCLIEKTFFFDFFGLKKGSRKKGDESAWIFTFIFVIIKNIGNKIIK